MIVIIEKDAAIFRKQAWIEWGRTEQRHKENEKTVNK